jgi:hypothetical protein
MTGALLVIDQDLAGHAAEPLEGPDQRLVGMLGILGVGPPKVEAARVAQCAHREVHRDRLPGDHRPLLAPVRLQLSARLRLEAHRHPARAQRPLRPHVVPQDRDPARIPLGLELPEQHDSVPHALTQELIYLRTVRVEQTPTPTPPRRRRPASLQGPAHRPRVHAHLLGDVAEVDTPFHQCLNRHEVLQSQHAVPPPDCPSVKGHSGWWLGDFLFRRSPDFYHRR